MTEDTNGFLRVELRPFKHQVGGHMCVLEVGRSVICKPYAEREVWFYQHAPTKLKDFIPRYIGETEVLCDLSEKRGLVASVPSSVARHEGLFEGWLNCHVTDACPRKRRKKSRDALVATENKHKDTKDILTSWSNACFDRQINKYGFWANNQPQKFIMLENLVAGYGKPCLMDLKMGRRQFGGDSDEEKRKLLESRCAGSTSSSLGFRLCGSQSYKANTSTYTFHDKYYGRSLNDSGAKDEIRQFFHNGNALRRDVVFKILDKLKHLQAILESDRTLFFHAASLLLIYDGFLPSKPGHLNTTNRIDNKRPQDHQSGLTQQTQPCIHPCMLEPLASPCSGQPNSHISDKGIDQTSPSSNSGTYNDQDGLENDNNCNGPVLNSSNVDVRMIDFAHVSETQTWVKEESIVFGLVKLQEMLTDLLQETNDAMCS